ncbi:hypothetical protein Vadar_026416 [Vaccinium darrowii]|uniref:Uncharacterized protein n=1 Tax=Vaccinium darrowii TaxID=229202 RepID=A0ACB7Y368_9ERIC|nr:hypothetical protein Vadar_026416 [Vaccinium darrowii]
MGSCENQVGNQQNFLFVNGPIIVGAGPSGLAVSACLKSNGIPSLILERSDCLASLWQQRTRGSNKQWKRLSSIQNLGFGGIQTRDFEYISRWLVVATGENAEAFEPEIQGIDKFEGVKVHTSGYVSGCEFRNQRVLVVGCGNSGMEVSLDLCRHNASPHLVVRSTVHILPREMFGFSTFGIAMALLKWLPLRIVDKFLLFMANFTLGNTDKLGLRRPKTGPIELKNATGKTPVLDVGALSQIKSGKIKVVESLREITRNGAKFMDGQEKEFDSIILATGYKSNVPCWLKGSNFFTGGWNAQNTLS